MIEYEQSWHCEESRECPVCFGTGQTEEDPLIAEECGECDGKGYVTDY